MTIVLIDTSSESLTFTWPAVPDAVSYRLEFRTTAEDEFQVLSTKLTQTQARKKNLTPEETYFFRVAAITKEDSGDPSWTSHEQGFQTLSKQIDEQRMLAPSAVPTGNHVLLISWTKRDEDEAYELQMRENQGGMEWATIAANLQGTQVKKKNLMSTFGYQFRVRPSPEESSNKEMPPFSSSSPVFVAKSLSTAMKRWFHNLTNGTLLTSGDASKSVPLEDALGGKEFVLLYASAHWCPPCRKFTPMLANWYRSMRQYVEVVFVSCDHDEQGFQGYFSKEQQPWLAIDYEDDGRESMLANMKVKGIPRLMVIHAETGKIVEDNAVGKPLDLAAWRLQSQQR